MNEFVPILAAVVGGSLAAGTGWLLDWRREKAKFSQFKRLICTGILDDLQHSMSLYDKIAEEWQKTKTVWFSTLNELRESRQTYLNHRDYVLLFDDPQLRKNLFRYYLKTSEAINVLEFQQNRKYEIRGKYWDLIRQIKLSQPQISDQDAVQKATDFMMEEDNELIRLGQELPDTVKQLNSFKAQAQELVNDLGNS